MSYPYVPHPCPHYSREAPDYRQQPEGMTVSFFTFNTPHIDGKDLITLPNSEVHLAEPFGTQSPALVHRVRWILT